MADGTRTYLERMGRMLQWWMIALYTLGLMHIAASTNPMISLVIALLAFGCGIYWSDVHSRHYHRMWSNCALATGFVYMIATIDNVNLGLLHF